MTDPRNESDGYFPRSSPNLPPYDASHGWTSDRPDYRGQASAGPTSQQYGHPGNGQYGHPGNGHRADPSGLSSTQVTQGRSIAAAEPDALEPDYISDPNLYPAPPWADLPWERDRAAASGAGGWNQQQPVSGEWEASHTDPRQRAGGWGANGQASGGYGPSASAATNGHGYQQPGYPTGNGYAAAAATNGGGFTAATNGNGFATTNGNGYPPAAGNGYPAAASTNGFTAVTGGNGYPPAAGNGSPAAATNGNGFAPATNGNGFTAATNGNGFAPTNGNGHHTGGYAPAQPGGYPPQGHQGQAPGQTGQMPWQQVNGYATGQHPAQPSYGTGQFPTNGNGYAPTNGNGFTAATNGNGFATAPGMPAAVTNPGMPQGYDPGATGTNGGGMPAAQNYATGQMPHAQPRPQDSGVHPQGFSQPMTGHSGVHPQGFTQPGQNSGIHPQGFVQPGQNSGVQPQAFVQPGQNSGVHPQGFVQPAPDGSGVHPQGFLQPVQSPQPTAPTPGRRAGQTGTRATVDGTSSTGGMRATRRAVSHEADMTIAELSPPGRHQRSEDNGRGRQAFVEKTVKAAHVAAVEDARLLTALRALLSSRSLYPRILFLAMGFASIGPLGAAYAELLPLPAGAQFILFPCVMAVSLLILLHRDTWGRRALVGYLSGIVAVLVYDVVRLSLVPTGIWGDPIPDIGRLLLEDPEAWWGWGYVWRFLGNGAGMGMAFTMLPWRGVKSGMIYGALICLGLFAVLLIWPVSQAHFFAFTPFTAVGGMVGHLVYGGVLGWLTSYLLPPPTDPAVRMQEHAEEHAPAAMPTSQG